MKTLHVLRKRSDLVKLYLGRAVTMASAQEMGSRREARARVRRREQHLSARSAASETSTSYLSRGCS